MLLLYMISVLIIAHLIADLVFGKESRPNNSQRGPLVASRNGLFDSSAPFDQSDQATHSAFASSPADLFPTNSVNYTDEPSHNFDSLSVGPSGHAMTNEYLDMQGNMHGIDTNEQADPYGR